MIQSNPEPYAIVVRPNRDLEPGKSIASQAGLDAAGVSIKTTRPFGSTVIAPLFLRRHAPAVIVVELGYSPTTPPLLAGAALARRHALPLLVFEEKDGDLARIRRKALPRILTARIVSRLVTKCLDDTAESPTAAEMLAEVGVRMSEPPATGVGGLELGDLPPVVSLHVRSFPESATTHLGAAVVERYYRWQFIGNHPRPFAAGVRRNDKLIGFVFGGRRRDAVSGYTRRFLPTIAAGAIRHPTGLKRLAGPQVAQVLRLMSQRGRGAAGPIATRSGQLQAGESDSFGILAIAVDPEARGSGAAQALLQAAEDAAINGGFKHMHLSVAPSNHRAVRFYLRCGWRHDSHDGSATGKMVKDLG